MSRRRCPFWLGDKKFAALVDEFIAQRPQVRTRKSREEYRLAPCAFRSWWLVEEHTSLDEEVVRAWILHRTARAAVMTVSLQTLIISLFVDFLVTTGRWPDNPFQTLRSQHRARGMRGIVRLLAETGSAAQLDERADVPFSGPLGAHFRRYLDHRSILSIKGGAHEVYLASFERFLRQRGVDELSAIDHALVEEWNQWQGQTTEHNHRYRMLIISKCFDFFVGYQLLECSPVPELLRHRRRSLPPYIYTRDEVRRILAAAEALADQHLLPHRGPTYRTFLLTLYTLGLRRNEALELRLSDLDFGEGTLTVREGKFRKGRVLPFGPRYAAALQRFISTHPLLRGAVADAYLFPTASCRTTRLSHKTVAVTIEKLVAELGIVAPPETQRPGLHSFRHSFAVHRVERWHREGADLSVKLPLLSAFLGHRDLASTQVYLTMTPERLRLVGESFERMFGTASSRSESP